MNAPLPEFSMPPPAFGRDPDAYISTQFPTLWGKPPLTEKVPRAMIES